MTIFINIIIVCGELGIPFRFGSRGYVFSRGERRMMKQYGVMTKG